MRRRTKRELAGAAFKAVLINCLSGAAAPEIPGTSAACAHKSDIYICVCVCERVYNIQTHADSCCKHIACAWWCK